jgi:hypothetical protein
MKMRRIPRDKRNIAERAIYRFAEWCEILSEKLSTWGRGYNTRILCHNLVLGGTAFFLGRAEIYFSASPFGIAFLRPVFKILLIPLVCGLGYELIKLAGRKDNWFTRFISKPGVWVQHITTVEPDDGMIECAIKALEAVIPEDGEADKW